MAGLSTPPGHTCQDTSQELEIPFFSQSCSASETTSQLFCQAAGNAGGSPVTPLGWFIAGRSGWGGGNYNLTTRTAHTHPPNTTQLPPQEVRSMQTSRLFEVPDQDSARGSVLSGPRSFRASGGTAEPQRNAQMGGTVRPSQRRSVAVMRQGWPFLTNGTAESILMSERAVKTRRV